MFRRGIQLASCFAFLLPCLLQADTPSGSEQKIAESVRSYFMSLSKAQYEQATKDFKGDVSSLQSMVHYENDLPLAEQFKESCESLFICLPVDSIKVDAARRAGMYDVLVSFRDESGDLLDSANCCGMEDEEPMTEFSCTAWIDKGKVWHDCLPVYIP